MFNTDAFSEYEGQALYFITARALNFVLARVQHSHTSRTSAHYCQQHNWGEMYYV
jgi:hypothetical protein